MQGRPQPLVGGEEPGPSWRAFPFSAAENLFVGTMGVATSNEARKKKQREQEEMSDGGSAPSSFIAGEGQPAILTIMGNDGFSLHAAGTHQVGQLPRQRGESETPTSNQSPRVKRGLKLLGPAALRTCPLASPRSQVRARLGPGGYCRRSGNGGPQTCLPAAHSVAKPAGRTANLHQQGILDPREADDAGRPLE